MTRLKTCDINTIVKNLDNYNRELIEKTGHSLLGIACHACGRKKAEILKLIDDFAVSVVPVTAGQGIITTFSDTVAAIMNYLGFQVSVTTATDTAGVAEAFENKAHGIMMSDDNRFVGLNLTLQQVADNSESTGRGYAAALDLMAGGLKEQSVVVVGCGPVGTGAATWLKHTGAHVVLYDVDPGTALDLKNTLCNDAAIGPGRVSMADQTLEVLLHRVRYVVEATPVENSIPGNALFDNTYVAAPGVPLGVSKNGCERISSRLIHDKLEIGVATMAVSML
ncbi:pyrrolysine biosynthesis protein PylD [Desulfocicer vacuolatum DSM 3385]|uniref:Pyrrolysine biosynthesis protein PylD n=1 Tax=Desulfocicer vacuolatum DSM 3385 TaxID=1121400 RepID=A0A1W2CQ32_9BACT|nr:3-methylornithyl-N6-L-lysine dehydrogenase PylD [Desulfocicer vacuolatum]SMC87340.1 pyrrolysine biosynthesis protein PylD [Desulfocicer vacuolatum DSM 3385]